MALYTSQSGPQVVDPLAKSPSGGVGSMAAVSANGMAGVTTSQMTSKGNFGSTTQNKTLNRKVARGPIEDKELNPSEFLRIMSLNTQQYLDQVTEVRPARIIELLSLENGQKETGHDINEPLFQPYPSEVRFQSYVPFETFEVPLTFRNVDRVARRITIQPFESAFFKVIPPPGLGKVAAGMDVTFTVQFSPDDNKDYSEDLVCVTDREKFVVPVRAVGARAIIDFPDKILFPTSVVKHDSVKTLLVRNIGKRKANFSLSTSEPFSIEPRHAQLDVGQSMQVQVHFCSSRVGSSSGKLKILYSTGEQVVSELSGSAEDANVRLEKNSLRMDNTFLSRSCQRIVRIFNRRYAYINIYIYIYICSVWQQGSWVLCSQIINVIQSDVSVHFEWKLYATAMEEERHRLRNTIELQRAQANEFDEFAQLMHNGTYIYMHKYIHTFMHVFCG